MDDPIAFFLTWTTYGSWLPGDERGWVKRPGQFMAADSQREIDAAERMSESELSLQPEQRDLVEKTIADHCQHRGWHLHAVNCRTQHVHVVVTALAYEPDDVMDQFKPWCTRRLKELATKANQSARVRYWTRLGSKRKIFDEDGLAAAIRYVVEDQDGPR